MRGLAAAAVMLHHAEQFYGHPSLFAHAYLAVDFFFMLSGFVINASYVSRFAQGLSVIGFMQIRGKRLWPTMAIGVALGTVLALMQGHAWDEVAVDSLAGLSFVPILRGNLGLFILDGVEWSLLFELVANIAHRLLIWRLRDGTCLLLGICLLLVMADISLTHHGIGVGDRGETFLFGFPRVALPYLIGVLLQRTWNSGRFRLTWPFIGVVALVPTVLIAAALPQIAAQWASDLLIVAFIFPAIIWLGAGAEPAPRQAAFGALSGALSFPLYAIHLPLLGFGELIARAVPPLWGITARLAALMACILCAWLIARYVDGSTHPKRAEAA